MAASLVRLLASPPRNFHVFRRVIAFSLRHGQALGRLADPLQKMTTTNAVARHPLATTFVQLRVRAQRGASGGGSALETTLGWLLLELHLGGSHPQETRQLATRLRGISEDPKGSPLLQTIAECDGLLQLATKMDALLLKKQAAIEAGADIGLTGHKQFDSDWKSSLGAICRDLLSKAPSVDFTADDADLDAPLDSPDQLPLDPFQDDQNPAAEPEDGSSYADELPEPDEKPFEVFRRQQRSGVSELYRRSSPDLFQDADSIAPAFLLSAQRTSLLEEGLRAHRCRDLLRLEQCFIHLLALEAGLTDREAECAVFAAATMPGVVSIDLAARALRRPEMRPPNAWHPPDGTDQWDRTGGDALFPLSRSLVSLGYRLVRARRTAAAEYGEWLIQPGTVRAVNRACVATQHVPGLLPSQYRRRLASAIADRLGIDAAQLAFGDSFGTNIAPVYYSRFQASAILQEIASCNTHFGVELQVDGRSLAAATHWIGSRAVASSSPFHLAWNAHGPMVPMGRGRPSRRGTLQRWQQFRHSLALHLALATGHRPTRALADVRLSDFAPEHALVVLADKRTDPAHLTRVASTGWRLIGVLHDYIAFLKRVANDAAWKDGRELAKSILCGKASIFDIPRADGSIEALDVSALFAGLPGVWSARPNLHRHALCQYLIGASVDPELRYFQMGWQICDAHATSEAAPLSAIDLTSKLAETIDKWLLSAGWLGGHTDQKGPFHTTSGLGPWDERRRLHNAEADAHQERLRSALRSARASIRQEVVTVLVAQLERLAPEISVTGSVSHPATRMSASSRAEVPVRLSAERISAILEPFESALHRHVAKVELRSILRQAMKRGECIASLPRVQWFLARRQPSQFLRGAGAALDQASAFRAALFRAVANANRLPESQMTARLAVLALWATVAFSPYRSLGKARRILEAFATFQFSRSQNWVLRIPDGKGHAVLSGSAAALLKRVGEMVGGVEALSSAAKLSEAELGSVVADLLEMHREPIDGSTACSRMIHALLVAGDLELNGPERLVMHGEITIGAVDAVRAASACDAITVHDINPPEAAETPTEYECEGTIAGTNRPHRPKRRIDDLMRMFSSGFDGLIANEPAAPAKRRLPQLRPLVLERMKEMGRCATFGAVVLDYVLHLMDEGGPKSAGGMQSSTIYKIYHHLAPALASIPDDMELPEQPAEMITAAVLTAFRRARRRDSQDVLDDLRQFFSYAGDRFGVAPPDWGILSAAAGIRVRPSDPAVVTDAETTRILDVLAEDFCNSRSAGPDPVQLRFVELKFAAALIAEASGSRPASIRGLTLADLYLNDASDRVRLSARGRYGDVKTSTSAGFIPLEGAHWLQHRAWFEAWLHSLCLGRTLKELEQLPLFQIPGEALGVRFRMADVFAPIGALLRWSTARGRARTYWLRKRRVSKRFGSAMRAPGPTARQVVRTVRLSGHASIRTPMADYVGDPLSYLGLDALTGGSHKRGATSLGPLVGVPATTVDVRWHRAAARSTPPTPESVGADRMASLLSLADPCWEPYVFPPAPVRPCYRINFSWRSVADVIHHIACGDADLDIERSCGVLLPRVAEVRALLQELELRTGVHVGLAREQIHRPRSRVIDHLLKAEDRRLVEVAVEWVSLARAWPGSQGAPLLDPAAVTSLSQVLEELGLEMTMKAGTGRPPLYSPVARRGRSYGGWQAARWALAVAWIGSRLNQ